MLDHDKHEPDLENSRRNREEVDRDQLFGVVLQECPPGLRWRFRMPDQILTNRRFRNLYTQFQKLAADPGRSPADVVSAYSPNQIACFFRNTRPLRLSMSNLPNPV